MRRFHESSVRLWSSVLRGISSKSRDKELSHKAQNLILCLFLCFSEPLKCCSEITKVAAAFKLGATQVLSADTGRRLCCSKPRSCFSVLGVGETWGCNKHTSSVITLFCSRGDGCEVGGVVVCRTAGNPHLCQVSKACLTHPWSDGSNIPAGWRTC